MNTIFKKAVYTASVFFIATAIISAMVSLSCSMAPRPRVGGLRCQNLVNPEAVEQVLLSWQIQSSHGEKEVFRAPVTQTAWEIEIASTKKALTKGKADVWQSGWHESDRQLNIEPAGVEFKPGVQYWWRARVNARSDKPIFWDKEPTPWSEPASFSVGPQDSTCWQARWITADRQEGEALPYFRKTFDASRNGDRPVRAIVYLSGLGCSDLYLNGHAVDSTRFLDPAQSNYEQYAYYSTFDITKLLKAGKNCIGVALGDGWYNQGVVWGKGFSYGEPLLFLQMELFYADGSRQVVATDESWQWTPGPTLSSNIYAGEVYDANNEVADWSKASTDTKGWRQAVAATSGTIPPRLRPQTIEPIRMKNAITPIALWQKGDGHWVFDFGVNVAAIPLIKVEQPKGTHLVMRMGEFLNPDSTINYGSTGVFATHVVQTDEYICAGTGVETWSPRFTYHGFRYIELTGASGIPDKSWIQAVVVHTDVEKIGTFKCSDSTLNRMHEMAIRTMLSNIHGLPTDCPHRERCGWLGDAHAVAPFENMNYGMHNFWLKYLEDIRSTSSVFLSNTLHQKLYNREFYFADKLPGIPFMIAPGKRLCGVASPDWGTAVVQLPWYVYLYYGDTKVLDNYYPLMKQWVDHIASLAEAHIVPYGLGDWCPPEGNTTIDCPIPLSSTLFHYYDISILACSAAILGKSSEAAAYNQLKNLTGQAILNRFFDTENHTFGSQTADAMALDFGLIPENERQAVSNAIVSNIDTKYDRFFHTGIFGLGRIGQALSRNGNAQKAWDTFTKKGENSFEYMWTHADATTLWEILPVSGKSRDACLKGNASLSHPMQAVYDSWFYEDVAGLRPDPSGPGYKVIRFEPSLMNCLDWAEASIKTPYGTAVSKWTHADGRIRWTIVIPPNTSGLVALPNENDAKTAGVQISEYPVVETHGNTVIRRFPSGLYNFKF